VIPQVTFNQTVIKIILQAPGFFDVDLCQFNTDWSFCCRLIGCLRDPANVQQTSSKRPALHLLEVCWTFAASCKHPITILLALPVSITTFSCIVCLSSNYTESIRPKDKKPVLPIAVCQKKACIPTIFTRPSKNQCNF